MSIAATVDCIAFPSTISGWAYNHENPSSEVVISAFLDGQLLKGRYTWGHQREFLTLNEGKIGFRLDLEEELDWSAIGSGRLSIESCCKGEDRTHVPIWDEYLSFIQTVSAFHAGKRPQNFTSEKFAETVRWLKRSGLQLDASWYERFLFAVEYSGRNVPMKTPIRESDLSQLRVPAGIRSTDGSAIIGKFGHALLVGGSNNVSEIYKVTADDQWAVDLAERWMAVIGRRVERVSERAKFMQIVIPEKTTSLRSLIEMHVPDRSFVYEQIEKKFSYNENYCSVFSLLDGQTQYFRRFDTHLSPTGAWAVARSIVQYMGLSAPATPQFDSETFVLGDLSSRFFDVPVYDHFMSASETTFAEPELLSAQSAYKPGGHIGIRRHWRNDGAPIDAKLFVSGNSFCGEGADQTTLNWWFSRLFREVFFDFNPTFDIALCEDFAPDYVVAQTIERFLSQVPSD